VSAEPLPIDLAVVIELGLAPRQHAYELLPLRESLIAYRDEGKPVGHFLTALLSNDLVGACGAADQTNLWLLPIYAAFLYNEMPSRAWGSAEKVAAWLEEYRERRAALAQLTAGIPS
jgi:hypothetical protein